MAFNYDKWGTWAVRLMFVVAFFLVTGIFIAMMELGEKHARNHSPQYQENCK